MCASRFKPPMRGFFLFINPLIGFFYVLDAVYMLYLQIIYYIGCCVRLLCAETTRLGLPELRNEPDQS